MGEREELLATLERLLHHVDDITCIHESVHRGGSIWTICDDCGRKWADDRGGFKPYCDAPEVAAARKVVESRGRAQSAPDSPYEEYPAAYQQFKNGKWVECSAFVARGFDDTISEGCRALYLHPPAPEAADAGAVAFCKWLKGYLSVGDEDLTAFHAATIRGELASALASTERDAATDSDEANQ